MASGNGARRACVTVWKLLDCGFQESMGTGLTTVAVLQQGMTSPHTEFIGFQLNTGDPGEHVSVG
jgi:hypothetical protein